MSGQQEKSGRAENGAPMPRSLSLILALVGVATLSGLLIVTAYQVTLPTIKANKALALRKSVFDVIPGAARVSTYRLEADGSLALLTGDDDKAVKFYAGYTEAQQLAGVAVEAYGQGFQDVIKVIYGYAPESQSVVGMRVLESKETPGLGDKIGNDPAFLANFDDLDVTLKADRAGLSRPIVVVKHGTRSERWQIDAITGATISSKAIGKLLNRSAGERIPQIVGNLPQLREGK